jgi:hypothetical protein
MMPHDDKPAGEEVRPRPAQHGSARRVGLAGLALAGLALAVFWVASLVVTPGARPASTAPAAAGAGTPAPALDTVPQPQRPALADGTVTRAEYDAAYEAFAACVAAGGGRLEEQQRDPSNGSVYYRAGNRLGTPWLPDLTSVEGRCHHETFDSIELAYQLPK